MATEHPRESLWVPIVAPVIWSAHFMICYGWAAMACGRFSGAGFERAHTGISIVTIVAAIACAGCLWYGFERHGRQLPDQPNDEATPEDRTQFMAVVTMLLAALSLAGVLFAGIAAVSVGGCG